MLEETQFCLPKCYPFSIVVPKARRIQWLNHMSTSCHTPFRKTVFQSHGPWVLILMQHNEEGHRRKVVVGRTSGRNKFPRIKGLRVQPEGPQGAPQSKQTILLMSHCNFLLPKAHMCCKISRNGVE